jgi:hypothetical protein
MLDDAQEIVNTAKSTVNEVQQSIITPIRAIGNVLSRISGLVERLKRN